MEIKKLFCQHPPKTGTPGYANRPLQFQQWDPGGCSPLYAEGPLDLATTRTNVIITQQNCPNFNLEDKVDFNGDSNVMNYDTNSEKGK